MKWKQLNDKHSKKYFRKTAESVKSRNFRVAPMRGGYRL